MNIFRIQVGVNDVKQVLSKLAELRYTIVTDKPLQKIVEGPNADIWNNELDIYSEEVSFLIIVQFLSF